MSRVCFLCSQEIDGDEKYYEFHLNQCLDVKSGVLSHEGEGEGRRRIDELIGCTGEEEYDSIIIMDPKEEQRDHEVALQLERDSALALSLSFQEDDDEVVIQQSQALHGPPLSQPNRPRPVKVPVASISYAEEIESQLEAGCPSCGKTWYELNIRNERDWNSRTDHIDECEGNPCMDSMIQEDRKGTYYEIGNGKGKATRGTEGLIPILQILLSKSHSSSKTKSALLCTPTTHHIQTLFTDFGWGCGYRNLQMIFSSLRELDCYAPLYAGKEVGGKAPIPTILECQEILEMAWRTGYDPAAALHFKKKLKGTRKWIGTTEVYVAFVWLGIRAKIVDFPSAGKGPNANDPHEILIKWIYNYFETPTTSSPSASTSKRPLPSSSSSDPINALEVLMESKGSAVKIKNKQPLYLQHQGHSRTVVGLEVGKNGESWLIIFDPSKYPKQPLREAAQNLIASNAASAASSKRLKLSPSPPSNFSSSSSSSKSTSNAFWSQQPGKGTGIAPPAGNNLSRSGFGFNKKSENKVAGGLDTSNYSKLLEPYRVSLNSLRKNCEYQILYVEEGPMLTEQQKLRRKVVLSSIIT